ncbi:MAG: MFS transporter [Acidimicrobiales bacterium]
MFASALTAQAVITSVLAVVLGTGVRNPIVLLRSSCWPVRREQPARRHAAMQPDLVPPEELMQMVSLGVYSWNSGRVVGPIIRSLLVLAVGPAWTISFNAFSFLVMAVAVLALRQPFQPQGDGGTIRSRLATGARALAAAPGCWHALRMLALVNTMMVPFMGLIPIYVQRGYGGSTQMVGIVASAQGSAPSPAASSSRSWRNGTPARRSWSDRSALRLRCSSPTLAPNLGLVVVAIFFLGGTWSCLFISLSAVIQRDAPPDSRGRVMSLMQATFGITYGFGLLGIGVLGDLTDLHIAFSTGAVIAIVGFVAITRRAPEWRAAINGHPIPDVA